MCAAPASSHAPRVGRRPGARLRHDGLLQELHEGFVDLRVLWQLQTRLEVQGVLLGDVALGALVDHRVCEPKDALRQGPVIRI